MRLHKWRFMRKRRKWYAHSSTIPFVWLITLAELESEWVSSEWVSSEWLSDEGSKLGRENRTWFYLLTRPSLGRVLSGLITLGYTRPNEIGHLRVKDELIEGDVFRARGIRVCGRWKIGLKVDGLCTSRRLTQYFTTGVSTIRIRLRRSFPLLAWWCAILVLGHSSITE